MALARRQNRQPELSPRQPKPPDLQLSAYSRNDTPVAKEGLAAAKHLASQQAPLADREVQAPTVDGGGEGDGTGAGEGAGEGDGEGGGTAGGEGCGGTPPDELRGRARSRHALKSVWR